MLPSTRTQQNRCHKSQQASSVQTTWGGAGLWRDKCIVSCLTHLLSFLGRESYRHGAHYRLVGLHNVGVGQVPGEHALQFPSLPSRLWGQAASPTRQRLPRLVGNDVW